MNSLDPGWSEHVGQVPICGILAGEPEVVGERCLDGGKCHHGCTSRCERRSSLNCVPLSGSGLDDRWLVPFDRLNLPEREQVIRQQAEALQQSCTSLLALLPLLALPHPGSPGASALIDSVLAEYNWPANTKNAARAGWEAASRWLAQQRLK